jgi:hypothetical protein
MTIRFADTFNLDFAIEPNPIAGLWLDKMSKRFQWPMDDDRRFYNFDSIEKSQETARVDLQRCIEIINQHDFIIQRQFTSVDDQDFLNYLHNIFEKYHGLLDKQNTAWWSAAPIEVRQALAQLNIAVHRAESAQEGNKPRFVCTWFGMPKDSCLDKDLIQSHGKLTYEFGGVYLNYVEIGKTLEDLSIDDDCYIGDDAFQPFNHYSTDFNVRFYDEIADVARVYRYFEQNRSFFELRGIYTWDDYRCKPYRFKIAQLRSQLGRDEIVDMLSKNQHITDIYIT